MRILIALLSLVFLLTSIDTADACKFCAFCGWGNKHVCSWAFPCGEVGRVACGVRNQGCSVTFGDCSPGPGASVGEGLSVNRNPFGTHIQMSTESYESLRVQLEKMSKR
jgi:hypothetical protein